MPEPAPTLRDERYAITRLLGEGGQASTYEAVDKKTGRLVAVKRFQVRGAKSWKEVELAEREARVVASVDHPALPKYVDHFEEEGVLYLVTEKIEGESLGDLRKRGGRLSEAEVVRMLDEASAALDYLHGRAPPLIHRDLKPSNVIRRPDGSFAFIDFGSVRDRLRPEGGSTVVGTFGYMAPEQFQGRAVPATDVYAIGATAIAMLTGREPEDLPHRGLAIDVRAAVGRGTSKGLARALEAMLEPDPDKRPARLGPLLGGARDRPDHQGRQQRKRREREERKAEKRAVRRARPRRTGRPWFPISLVLAVGLTIAQLAVILALRVALPMLFHLLAIFFGRGMRDAASRVEEAGKAVGGALRRALEAVSGTEATHTQGGIRVRVAPTDDDAVRARVAARDLAEDDPEAPDVPPATRAKRQRLGD